MKLYGIPNCSTVKKARDWLAEHGVDYSFHDFKKLGVDQTEAQNWLKQADWTQLINRRGLTWRGLPDERKQADLDADSALALMLEKPSIIKRPLLVNGGKLLHIGFDATAYNILFNS